MRDPVFPEFADHCSDRFGTTARELLARAASAADFAALDPGKLTALLERASRQRFGRDKAKAIQCSAADSLGLATLGAAAHLEIQALLAQIRLLEAHVAQVDAAITPLLEHRDQALTTIPGVGAVPAATIRAEIGDTASRASAPWWLTPAGHRCLRVGPVPGRAAAPPQRGSLYLRRALDLATHSAHRRTLDLDASLQRKLAGGEPYRAALMATARKFLARISIVL